MVHISLSVKSEEVLPQPVRHENKMPLFIYDLVIIVIFGHFRLDCNVYFMFSLWISEAKCFPYFCGKKGKFEPNLGQVISWYALFTYSFYFTSKLWVALTSFYITSNQSQSVFLEIKSRKEYLRSQFRG